MKLTILELIILAAAYAFIGYSVFVLWQLFAYAGVRATLGGG
ncbi:hypothetical protein [Bradyrhizobium sp. 186]|nr:hypothetical protein [Bradyrhizobium sp. 186]